MKTANILKSTPHDKVIGDFGEKMVLYWLSKYGFECALVDHTGIDIIARNPHPPHEIMGISVESRTRTTTTEQDSSLFPMESRITIPNDNFEKATAACSAFGCVPYFAIVVDAGETIRAFILSMRRLLEYSPHGKDASHWMMTDEYLKRYAADEQIKTFEFRTQTTRWWEDAPTRKANAIAELHTVKPTMLSEVVIEVGTEDGKPTLLRERFAMVEIGNFGL